MAISISARRRSALVSQKPTFRPRARVAVLGLLVLAAGAVVAPVAADPFPPYWNGGGGGSVHFQPAPWPANDGDGELDNGDWVPYSIVGADMEDNGTQDPSNGGTSPQNYVNVSSGCTDLTLPSILLYYDDVNQVLMFRWRVEQIAHTYATGPSAGVYGSTDVWKSAQWTVLIDTDADGYREFAVLVDGSSGAPGTDVDRMLTIYSDTASQSIDYVNDPAIDLVSHNPTAFVDGPGDFNTELILNFQNALTPIPAWVNGSSETVWDYGTTRAVKIVHASCTEYFVDYQIPLSSLDATAVGGPQVTEDTPLCMLFSTANSLNNPLQKDVSLNCDPNAGCSYCADADEPAPYGDCFKLSDFGGGDLGTVEQPTVAEVTTSGCPPALAATVIDALLPTSCGAPLDSSIASVDFYYYEDTDADGVADDGNVWTFAAAGSEVDLGQWEATAGSWDTTLLGTGAFLVGVRAEDDQGNVTWSFLTQAEVDASFPGDFANPSPEPGIVASQFINTCGTSPTATKSASVASVSAGGTVDFTITLTADDVQALSVSSITDTLPAGWSYVQDVGGTLTPTTSPAGGASGAVSWTFAPAASIPAGASRTLIFRAQAPAATGTFSNVASAATGQGTLTTNLVQIGVGAPRLTISKTVSDATASPGDSLTFTIAYSNDSPISVTDAVITDALPTGLTFVSATGGGVHDGGSPGTITWDVGDLASGDGPFSVTFTATVDDPFPAGAGNPIVNTASIDSPETSPASDDAATFVSLPLAIQKQSSVIQIAPGNQVTYTIDFANTSGGNLANGVLTDVIPTGFSFVSATCGTFGCTPSFAAGTVTWNLGTVPPGNHSVTVTLQASSPYTGSYPAEDVATLSATGVSPVSDDHQLGITRAAATCPTDTLYFDRDTTDVGFDGVQRTANTTVPTSGTDASVTGSNLPTTFTEIVRFYQDPEQPVSASHDGNVTAEVFFSKSNGPKGTIRVTAYDYDPVTGATTQIGQAQSATGSGGGTFQASFSFAASGILLEGHRVLWVIDGQSEQANNPISLTILFDGVAHQSRGTICLTPLVQAIDKEVSAISATPGTTLTYTILFGNTGLSTTTGNTIVDVLPDGVSFVGGSATLNGVATVPAVAGQQLTFTVSSSGQAAGSIAAGASGTLVFQATIDDPFTEPSMVLTNGATLSSNQTDSVFDDASTTVTAPAVTIEKAASPTLVGSGESSTYTLTVTNLGNAASTNVTVSDPLPVTAYFTYDGNCSVDLTNAPGASVTSACTVLSGTLSLVVDQLDPGESFAVTFSLTVSGAPPAGFTDLSNTAEVYDDELGAGAPVESNEVIVTIATAPNLQLAKTSDAVGTLGAGDVVTYTLTLENTGFDDATDVTVTDPIPANTTFVAGTLTYQAVSQTDVNDGDTGRYEAVGDQVVFAIGTLAAGANRTMTFDVQLDSPFPNGTTTITNTATVTSTNTASKQASTDVTASAAPAWDLFKSGPASLAFPLTTLAAATGGPSTTLSVVSATYLAVGDWIAVNGTGTEITAISGTTVTVSTAVTGALNDAVNPVIEYTLRWENNGTATATGVVVTDALPAGTVFVSATGGGTHDGGSPGTVTWNVGTVAPGGMTTVNLRIRPTATGTYLNDFDVASNEIATATSNTVTTQVGALRPSKTTSTANVVNTPDGTKATYTLTVVNDSAVNATNVSITDTPATGFSYCDNGCDDGTTDFNDPSFNVTSGSRTSTVNPTVGDNPLTFCCWTVNAGATLTITFDAALSTAVGDGTYQNELETSSANVAALIFDPLSTTAEDVTVDFVGPNPVMLSGFGVSLTGGAVTVSWETDAELDAMAFRVYRLDPATGGYVAIHRDLLPGLIGSPQGGVYSIVDPTAPTDGPLSYLLVEVDGRGRRTAYGPYAVPAPVVGERLVPELAGKRNGYAAVPHPLRAAPRAEKAVSSGQNASGLRLGVDTDGLQRLPVTDLATHLGVSVAEAQKLVQSKRLRLVLGDREATWTAEGDPKAASAILFYGRAGDTRWSAERFYRLETTPGHTMASVAGAPGTPVAGLTFRDTARFERDVYPLVLGRLDPDADLYYWDFTIAGIAGFDRRTFDLELDGAVSSAGAATARVRLQGASDLGSGHHGVALFWDGVPVGTTTLGSYEGRDVAATIPASLLAAGAHQLQVRATGGSTPGMSLVLIDRIAVDYDRAYRTTRPSVEVLRGAATTLAVAGLPSADAAVYDVSDAQRPKRVTGATATPSGGSWEIRFSGGGTRYLVTTTTVAPASVEADTPSDLLSDRHRADFVVVTTGELRESAERLADLRRAQGLEAMVVDVDDVYDELSGGQPTPYALRDFLAWAVAEWEVGPRYVALAGDGHYDFKNATGVGGNLLPPAIVAASWGLYASDGVLGDLLGDDGVPEVVVGRIPVSTAAELDAYVAKVAAAEAGGSWSGLALFTADDPDATGAYTSDSETLAALVPPSRVLDRVYLGPLTAAAARARLVADLRSGASIVSYLGHSGLTTLANEGLLTSADVPTLQNGDRSPVFLAMGCHLGNFAVPGSPSLGEDLLTRSDGGAIAVWSAAGLSYNALRAQLTAHALQAVYHRGERRLGDIVREALAAGVAGGLGRSLAESQILLGDPAILLPAAP